MRWPRATLAAALVLFVAALGAVPFLGGAFLPDFREANFVVFMVGIMSASFLAAGHAVVGGLMVQATSVLDGVDGETARLQMRAGPRGAWLDGMLDRMVDAAIVAGLGLWALTKPFGGRSVLLLLAIAIAWAVIAMGTREASATYSLPHATEHQIPQR